MKSNVLPFPSLRHAPPDPKPMSAARVLGVLLGFAAITTSLGLTLWSLFM